MVEQNVADKLAYAVFSPTYSEEVKFVVRSGLEKSNTMTHTILDLARVSEVGSESPIETARSEKDANGCPLRGMSSALPRSIRASARKILRGHLCLLLLPFRNFLLRFRHSTTAHCPDVDAKNTVSIDKSRVCSRLCARGFRHHSEYCSSCSSACSS